MIRIAANPDRFGSAVTCLQISSAKGGFRVRVIDICCDWPVYLPMYQAILTTGDDPRSCDEIVEAIARHAKETELEELTAQTEETYENASRENISLHGPVWLGIGQDMRLFSADMHARENDVWAWIEPRLAGQPLSGKPSGRVGPEWEQTHPTPDELMETDNERIRYQFTMGRGTGCVRDYQRRLDRGYLPVLVETVRDKQILYETRLFASLEKTSLSEENNLGTHYLVADYHGVDVFQTEDQKSEAIRLWEKDRMLEKEEIVVFLQTTVTNHGPVPSYAWFKAPHPAFAAPGMSRRSPVYTFAGGYGRFSHDRVFCYAKIDGRPLPQEEVAILVNPGEELQIEFIIPHQPVSETRAKALSQINFLQRYLECVAYWESRRSVAANIFVPEKPVNEMLLAGLIHLDIATYGSQPEGTLAATIGIYSSLGSENWPIIQYYDSMGLHDKARRCIQYFYDKQHPDGFMRNYGGYKVETGVVLWTTAEHFLYTQDNDWLMSIMAGIKKACTCLLQWRERNKREDLIGAGYGLLEGRATDTPDNDCRQYLLNAWMYKGLSAIAQVCLPFDEAYWRPVLAEIACYRSDIQTAVKQTLQRGPVIPLKDGSWCPTTAPWADADGPVSFYSDQRNWYTHGMFVARDSHLNTLVFCGVFDLDDPCSDWILNSQLELYFIKNVRPSQPYYARHPYLHLLRGEANAFIKNYYNALTSLADRETYSFWEHYLHASPHKTHEEGCFLMETRWMLYLEKVNVLYLLQGIPSRWLENGKEIRLERVASHYGHFNLSAASQIAQGYISAKIEFTDSRRSPKSVVIRLPHPQGHQPDNISGGNKHSLRDCYTMDIHNDTASITISFKHKKRCEEV